MCTKTRTSTELKITIFKRNVRYFSATFVAWIFNWCYNFFSFTFFWFSFSLWSFPPGWVGLDLGWVRDFGFRPIVSVRVIGTKRPKSRPYLTRFTYPKWWNTVSVFYAWVSTVCQQDCYTIFTPGFSCNMQ